MTFNENQGANLIQKCSSRRFGGEFGMSVFFTPPPTVADGSPKILEFMMPGGL